MTTTQDMILDAITQRVENGPLTLVRDGEWANTGTLRTFDGLDLVAELRYSFQRDNCRFGKTMSPVVCHYYGKARTTGQIPAVKSTISEVVDTVVAYLTGDES